MMNAIMGPVDYGYSLLDTWVISHRYLASQQPDISYLAIVAKFFSGDFLHRVQPRHIMFRCEHR